MTSPPDDTTADTSAIIAALRTERDAALAREAALAEVLGVINHSPSDTQRVFDLIAQRAAKLCEVPAVGVALFDGTMLYLAAQVGFDAAYAKAYAAQFPRRAAKDSIMGRAILSQTIVQIEDIDADPAYGIARPPGPWSALAVPLVHDGTPLGVIAVGRPGTGPYPISQVTLLQAFATQAMIAMENARLLGELRQRTADLEESLEYRTAISDVLKVISRSTFGLQPILDTLVETAVRLCAADSATVMRRGGDIYRAATAFGYSPEFKAFIENHTFAPGRGSITGRVALEGRAVHVVDAANDPQYTWTEGQQIGNFRTMLGVPLLREDALIGVIVLARKRVEPFTDRQIELVSTFADQAVIAMENARLLGELHNALDAAQATLRELKTTQANLIQAEKMASLGQLTAGIAHEIKNPLNFVNNFAALSVDLLSELKETAAPGFAVLSEKQRAEVEDVSAMLTSNLEKITEHGKRADSIVKAMLEHSRGSSGERRIVDLNALIDEALNLAYHGARAQDQSFNITLEREFGEGIAPIEVNPQDITRVFLNIFSNGFYAVTKRARADADAGFVPTLKVTTRDTGGAVEIHVRDNGVGIPDDLRDKIFQPFVTSKPSGEGTGLGLSITYDIVTKAHGGSIAVESKVDEYSEIAIQLPRRP